MSTVAWQSLLELCVQKNSELKIIFAGTCRLCQCGLKFSIVLKEFVVLLLSQSSFSQNLRCVREVDLISPIDSVFLRFDLILAAKLFPYGFCESIACCK